MTKRLIVFGDSMTWGEGLSDVNKSINEFGPASKFAWPEILAHSAGVEVVNNAIPGASNKFISDKILEFKFEKNDKAIILWSWHGRFHSYQSNPKSEIGWKIGPWNAKAKKPSQAYFQYIYSTEDSLQQNFIYINHIADYLKYKKIKNIQSLLDYDMRAYDCKFNRVKFYNFDLQYEDTANDGKHPGPKTHIQIAKKYWKHIKGLLND
tara:strand:+ start:662 stop:1285 length:624 start_codon:yes stop_codon:yes gene_type:complete